VEQSAIIEIFERELMRVEGNPVRVQRSEDAFAYLLRVARECNAKLVVRSKFDYAEKMALDKALNDLGIELVNISTTHNHIDKIKDADIGVTAADFAIAETGSIGIVTDKEIERLVSALPFIHIAFLHSKDILRTFADLKDIFKKHLSISSGRNSVVSLITGPSRTADIEQQHILGVHGPNQLHVVITED
jgi:L-lactate dehydrogenase complex protein LldG